MSRAFIDTSILTDALLNSGLKRDAAKALIKKYQQSEIPIYVIKEFKAGPLAYFRYMHNKLLSVKSVAQALAAVQAVSRKANLQNTAIQALSQASNGIAKYTLSDLVRRYGPDANPDVVYADSLREELKIKIFLAWDDRLTVATNLCWPLSCYLQSGPTNKRDGQIDLTPTMCDKGDQCCLQAFLLKDISKLVAVHAAIDSQPVKAENTKRMKVLKELISKGKKYALDKRACIALGDAVIDLMAPDDAVILTTNIRDHEPIAKAIGKTVETYNVK